MGAIELPDIDSGQTFITEELIGSPYSAAWWTSQVITNIPQDSVGWLVAQGWRITGISYDARTTPQTPYYAMARASLQNWNILQALLNTYTDFYNRALTRNAVRYNDIVSSWDELLHNSQACWETQVTEQNAQALIILGNLDTYMDDVDTQIAATVADTTTVESDYTTHAPITTALLDGLGTTDLARINEEFAASLATQLQRLVDQGLYNSIVAVDVMARNTRDRDDQIQKLNDQLNREKVNDEHHLYEQQVKMRTVVSDIRRNAIISKMNVAAARLSGLKEIHAENMRLMAYQLDERNKLLIGLYGVVERREDQYPSFENLVQLSVGLGDSGGGWVQP